MAAPVVYLFGPFALDPAAYRLSRLRSSSGLVEDEELIPLGPKSLDLLLWFVRQPTVLLTKDEIFRVLWPDVAVTDNALTQVVSELRQALGDPPAAPKYVQTVTRRGYRFVADVQIARQGPLDVDARASSGGAAATPSTGGPRSVVVLDFTNVTNDAEIPWLGPGLAETITNDLRALRDLRVIDRTGDRIGDRSGDRIGDRMAERTEETAVQAAGTDLVIVGSFQRSRDRLRITARAVDARTREALAHAKADGLLDDVFALQDAIVKELSAGLQITISPTAERRIGAHETSSLDAYRALTEGRLKLETLDPDQVSGAMTDFQRALDHDPDYALAHVGLAHARFWRYQGSRALNRPDRGELDRAIASARRAVDLDPELAEGHAALAFFLASAERPREAAAAGRLAVAIEPGNWRHQFRYGMAAWGTERVNALTTVLDMYPALAYAHFGLAMVHVARGEDEAAAKTLEAGIAAADAPSPGPRRFPPSGLHWLLGLVRLAEGDRDVACAEFSRELTSVGSRMFSAEYARDAYAGLGFARLAAGDARGALEAFEQALALFPAYPRSLIGCSLAADRLKSADKAAAARARAASAIDELRTNGRDTDATLATALVHIAAGRQMECLATLDRLLDDASPASAGWTMPVEPLLEPLRGTPAFDAILGRLAARAR